MEVWCKCGLAGRKVRGVKVSNRVSRSECSNCGGEVSLAMAVRSWRYEVAQAQRRVRAKRAIRRALLAQGIDIAGVVIS